MGTGAAV
jgi:hypothetical protein